MNFKFEYLSEIDFIFETNSDKESGFFWWKKTEVKNVSQMNLQDFFCMEHLILRVE